jgi:hypothetical protein
MSEQLLEAAWTPAIFTAIDAEVQRQRAIEDEIAIEDRPRGSNGTGTHAKFRASRARVSATASTATRAARQGARRGPVRAPPQGGASSSPAAALS